jgi:hypothetical protein
MIERVTRVPVLDLCAACPLRRAGDLVIQPPQSAIRQSLAAIAYHAPGINWIDLALRFVRLIIL